MNNMRIIANEAVASGFFTEEDVVRLIAEGRDIPFHTVSVWKNNFGMVPKRGSVGRKVRLWRRRCKNKSANKKSSRN